MYSTDKPRGERGRFVLKADDTKVCPRCRTSKNIKDDYYQRKDRHGRLYAGSPCKTCTKDKLTEWASANPKRVKETLELRQKKRRESGRTAKYAREHTQKLRAACLQKLGARCAWREGCSWTDPRCLHIDHVNGDGNEERIPAASLYRRVLADTTGKYQLLCANHNWIKRVENREDGRLC